MEKERADSCLATSLHERQEVERRWEERWGRHQASLTEQLETLRSNYEKTLSSVKAHEEALQKEVNNLRDKHVKSKEAWEAYRKSLNDQVKISNFLKVTWGRDLWDKEDTPLSRF